MENKKKKPAGHEDEIDAAISDVNQRKEKAVDSFKSGSKKQKGSADQPFDEQMHDPHPSES